MSDGLTTAVGGVPLVGIVMGSDSDWPIMSAAAEALAEFGVAHEVGVVSAHRMPEEMVEYGRTAVDRGLRVIIAGAGGAAHLPGMLASLTPLPVIGVPVRARQPRRARLAALDRADARRRAGRDGRGRQRAQRRTARRRACSPPATTPRGAALRERMARFQHGLNAAAKAKGKALRDSL